MPDPKGKSESGSDSFEAHFQAALLITVAEVLDWYRALPEHHQDLPSLALARMFLTLPENQPRKDRKGESNESGDGG